MKDYVKELWVTTRNSNETPFLDQTIAYVKNDVENTRVAYSKFYTGLKVKKVIFNNPATIIYWSDGTKTVVKCQEGDTYSKETGFVMAYLKKLLGNKNEFNKQIKKWVTEDKTDD